MSYLKQLKQIYNQEITSLENEFKIHCQKVIDEKLKEITPKIQKEIEEDILSYIRSYKFHDINEFDLESRMSLTEIYDSGKYFWIFAKYLEGNDEDDIIKAVENFIENLEYFKTIKKYLEIRFDGLIFNPYVFVKLNHDLDMWEIEKITVNLEFDLSNW